MPCVVHPDRETVASCVVCGNLICEACDVAMAGKHYCRRCLAQAERVPAGTAPSGSGGVRRLTRSTRDSMLAGVCGGLAVYGGLDPVLVRVLYAVITLLTGIVLGLIAYLVMALLVPKDNTI
jgi:phage shock protein C